MKYKALSIIFLIGFCVSLHGQAKFVVPVKKQDETLEMARRLLDTSVIEQSPEVTSKDPFNNLVELPKPKVNDQPIQAEEIIDDKDVLEAASRFLEPSGFVNSNGEEFLIMNGRKVKSGTQFNFPYRGKVFRLVISEITKTQFTLNLNQEAITLSME